MIPASISLHDAVRTFAASFTNAKDADFAAI